MYSWMHNGYRDAAEMQCTRWPRWPPIFTARVSPFPQMQTTVLASTIQIRYHSACERYTNTPRKCVGVLYKYTKKELGSAIKIQHHHSSVCNLHTMRRVPMAFLQMQNQQINYRDTNSLTSLIYWIFAL